MPIDIAIHQILAEQEVFHRSESFLLQSQSALCNDKSVNDVGYILGSIGNPTEKRIPVEVVKLVWIECPREDAAIKQDLFIITLLVFIDDGANSLRIQSCLFNRTV